MTLKLIIDNKHLFQLTSENFALLLSTELKPNNCRKIRSCALPGKMLLVRIIENNIIDAYFSSGYVEKLALGKGLGQCLAGLEPLTGAQGLEIENNTP